MLSLQNSVGHEHFENAHTSYTGDKRQRQQAISQDLQPITKEQMDEHGKAVTREIKSDTFRKRLKKQGIKPISFLQNLDQVIFGTCSKAKN